MPEGSSLGLRSVTVATAVALALAAVVVSAALVVLTTLLGHASGTLRDTVASVRLAEEAEIDLLLHARATDELVLDDIEDDLWTRLSMAEIHVTSQAEQGALE